MNDHIREKIAAMLAKTEANGATEDEAIAAAKLARKLMRQYGITVEDIAERKETVTDFVIAKSSTGVYKHVMDRFLAHAIGEFTETRAVVVKQKGMKAKADGIEVCFFGYRVDVELADFIYKTCHAAIDSGWDKYKVSLPTGKRAASRVPYMTGVSDRLTDRLYDLLAEDQEATTGTDLIVMKNMLVNAAFNQGFAGYKSKTSLMEYDFTKPAYRQGYKDGDSVSFNRSVQAPAEVKAIGG